MYRNFISPKIGKAIRDYDLYDMFSTARAASAVNGTLAEPVGGARTINDNGTISITGGVLSFATGALQNNGVFYGAQTRALGKTLLVDTVVASYALRFGFHTSQSGAISDGLQTGTTTYAVIGGVLTAIYGDLPAGSYKYAITQRASGMFIFIRGGVFTNWSLLYPTLTTSTATMYPALITRSGASVFTADNMRIPDRTFISIPLQSDGMSASTTDGLGNPENNGPTGNSYSGVGTPQVSGGVRSFSALSGGGLGVQVLACSTADVIIEVNVTRTAGSAGIIARRVDANNYVQCLHNGTNVIVSQVVAGVTTTLSTTAVTYSAGATMKFHLSGTAYRAFYSNTAAGSGTVPSSTDTNHGIITNNLSGSFDNLVIWATGNEGQHEGLNEY